MRVNREWRLLLLLLVGCVVGFASAQSNPASQPRAQSPGRYVVYYHPTNFNQALLLDTVTGSAWQLAIGKYKSEIKGKEGEEREYRMFERLGVDGLYKTEIQKLAERQEWRETSEEMRKESERQQRLKQLEIFGLESLREIAAKSDQYPFIFVSHIKQRWPEYKPLSVTELLRKIRDTYPQLVDQYPALFEPVKDH